MEETKQEQIFDKLNIYNYRLPAETFEDYKERQKIANKIIKQYLKGKTVYQCYETINIPWKEGSEEAKNNKKPRTINLRVRPPYTNPTKNEWRTKTNN